MSDTTITALLALMDAYRGEIWQHHTTRSDLYNAAMAELNALLVEADIAAARGRLAGLREARSRASDYDQSPGDDTPMGPLMVAQVQTAQNIINALSRRIAEIEGAAGK